MTVPHSYRRPGAEGHLARSLDLAAGHLPVCTATAGAGSPPEQAQTQVDTHPHLTQPASRRPGEYDGATLRALQNGGAEFVCVGRCGFQASAAATLHTEPLPARSHSPRARLTGWPGRRRTRSWRPTSASARPPGRQRQCHSPASRSHSAWILAAGTPRRRRSLRPRRRRAGRHRRCSSSPGRSCSARSAAPTCASRCALGLPLSASHHST